MSNGIRERVDALLSAEMDRANFLKVCGVVILASVGVTGLIRSLSSVAEKQTSKAAPQAGAYGGRTFGE